jgi:hypothetical protein
MIQAREMIEQRKKIIFLSQAREHGTIQKEHKTSRRLQESHLAIESMAQDEITELSSEHALKRSSKTEPKSALSISLSAIRKGNIWSAQSFFEAIIDLVLRINSSKCLETLRLFAGASSGALSSGLRLLSSERSSTLVIAAID